MTALIAAALVVGSALAAQARPDTRALSCEAARGLVYTNGAVVMTTGRHTYERIVANAAYCRGGEETESFYAPTADVSQCRVGNRCRMRINDGPRRFMFGN